ncbi:hypothetical protein NIES37_63370 [Tolypothrix tenuis PCC 7101]|uniref:Uncharacterized protein n=1 Tax=Tolypothrix tenuis PCC 7101 TaxID=231146 RepID=A0A1Z4N9F0_9CYAN|nr:hypothetical protein NIES37_63370 [Tolypothrix tenuis PCC 7101]BAZ73754.1 hypothetical protein NIES50_23200 [Aulosira laxa NIES-50]
MYIFLNISELGDYSHYFLICVPVNIEITYINIKIVLSILDLVKARASWHLIISYF